MPTSEALKKAQRVYWEKNKDKIYIRQQKRLKRIRREFYEYVSKLHCRRCGMSFETYPELCHFHHTNDLMKSKRNEGRVSLMATNGCVLQMNNELSVTIPLCANCHTIVHADAP
jgi:predicted HNH restriction endonuclease